SSTRNADICEAVGIAFKQETVVAERLIGAVAAEAYVDVAERGHPQQFAAGAEVLGGGWVENLFVAEEEGRLAIIAGDIEAVVIAGVVAGHGDLAADLAKRARDLASFEWRIVRPPSG